MQVAVTRHLRENHPQLWTGFRFPPDSPFVAPSEERADVLAQMGLAEYLRSSAWRNLGDAHLEHLIRIRRLCFYAACITLPAMFLVIVLPIL